ncbi:hypothetical protein QYE76_026271 [Lolium multiflorum]|uniref:Uncharacterized protein n=1 Tax=Lolium multiflorum TaxID=4521 RepID=A0AAD8RIF0_LOLMU|nr:hypothetical protein QYE76_026271 [Lolium multiflorum]
MEPPPLKAMLIFLACSSWAAAALLAAAFFTLSALQLVSISRRFSSAAHCAFVMPGGRSFLARGFLVVPFGGIVVDEKMRRRAVVEEKAPPGTGTGRRGEWRNSAGENGDMQANWREWRENRQDLVFLSPTTRVHTVFRAKTFHPESPSAPRGTGDGVGSPDG